MTDNTPPDGVPTADQSEVFRVKVRFPRGNTKSTAWVRANNRTQARYWAEDHWMDPVVHSILERTPPADADIHDARGDSDV